MAFSKKTNKTEGEKKYYNIKVIGARQTKNDSIVMVDLEVNDVKIYSCILKEVVCTKDTEAHKKGDICTLLNLPQEKGSDGKWYDRVWFPISNAMIDNVRKQVEEMLG